MKRRKHLNRGRQNSTNKILNFKKIAEDNMQLNGSLIDVFFNKLEFFYLPLDVKDLP